jgi:hypothetical protein
VFEKRRNNKKFEIFMHPKLRPRKFKYEKLQRKNVKALLVYRNFSINADYPGSTPGQCILFDLSYSDFPVLVVCQN